MGYAGISLRHMNAPHKEELGWLPAWQVVTVTQSGTYKIAPLELHPAETVAPQALKIARDLVRGPREAVLARIDEELVHFSARLRSAEARAAFEAFMRR